MENKTFLPEISRKKFEKNVDAWDYFYAILELYFEEMDSRWDEVFSEMTDSAVMLYIFRNLDAEVRNWWFIQLIYNWYWGMVFDSPFIDFLKEIWVEKTVKLLKKVKPVYKKYKEKIDNTSRENCEDFSKLYEELKEFDVFDDEYYDIDELEIFLKFVKENINDFVTLVD